MSVMQNFEFNISKGIYKTAIIILNWNGLRDTLECLHSIEKYAINNDFFIVIVDNNSNEPIDPLLNKAFKFSFIVIKNDTNSGFAAGNNIGIEKAMEYNPEYILLLNNDTVLVEDIFKPMTTNMDADKSIGVIGVVNYYFSDPLKIWQAGLLISLDSTVVVPVEVNTNEKLIEVDYVPGSSLMFRTSLISQIGILDENYFAYYEEVDFCLSVKKHGKRVVFITDSKILHKVGKSSPNVAKDYLRFRNRLYLFDKFSKNSRFNYIFVKEIIRFLKLSIKMSLLRGKFIYYKMVYQSIADFKNKRFGKGSFEKFL